MPLTRVVAGGALPGGEQWRNVLHYQIGDLDEDARDTLSENVAVAYNSLAAIMSAGWHLDTVSITDLETTEQTEHGYEVVGVAAGDNLPNEVCLVVSWRTGSGARTARGRNYLSGFTTAAQVGADDIPSGATAETVEAALEWATAIHDAPEAEGTLVVFSRKLETSRIVLSAYVDNAWDTQRRRGDVNSARSQVIFGE
jgi:hypothetical protein